MADGPPPGYAEVAAPSSGPPPGYAEVAAPKPANSAPVSPQTQNRPGVFSTLAEAQRPDNVTQTSQPGQGRIAAAANQAAVKQQLGLPVEFGEAGAQLLDGGAHFIRDLFDPTVPVFEGKDSLVNEYIVRPLQGEVAKAKAAQAAGNTATMVVHAAASDFPMVGPLVGQAWDQALRSHTASQYAAAGLQGAMAALGAKGMVEGAAGIPDVPGRFVGGIKNIGDFARDSAAAVAKKPAVVDASVRTLEGVRQDAQQTLAAVKSNVGNQIAKSVDTIETEDVAQLPQNKMGSIPKAPLHDALMGAMDKYGTSVGAKTPAINEALRELDTTGPQLTFSQLKSLRTSVGRMAVSAKGAEQGALWSLYDTYTDAMSNRASEIGLGDEFTRYNNLHEQTMNYMFGTRPGVTPSFPGTLGDLFKLDTGTQFLDYLRKPSNQPHLDALNQDFGKYGLPDNFFRDMVKNTKRVYQVAKNADQPNIGMGGKMRAFTAHPLFAGGAAVAAASTASALGPIAMAGRFIVTLLAAAKAADLADTARAAAEIRKLGGAPNVKVRFVEPAEPEEKPPGNPSPAGAPAAGGITFGTDSLGRYATSPDSPAKVYIPKNLTGKEAEDYAREKLDLQASFAASRGK